jgi:hypothetical protein
MMEFICKFGGLESVITGICDTYPQMMGKKRPYLVLFLIVVCFVLALPTVTNVSLHCIKYYIFDTILIVDFCLFEIGWTLHSSLVR